MGSTPATRAGFQTPAAASLLRTFRFPDTCTLSHQLLAAMAAAAASCRASFAAPTSARPGRRSVRVQAAALPLPDNISKARRAMVVRQTCRRRRLTHVIARRQRPPPAAVAPQGPA